MDSQLKNISDSQYEVTITYPYEEVKEEFAKEVAKKIQKISIPGFRKGKAPASYIKRLYGDSLEYEASETLANKFFWDYIDDQQIKLISKPVMVDIDLKIQELFKFTIRYEVLPQLDIQNYSGHTIEVPELTVTDEAINSQIQTLKHEHASFQEDSEVIDNNYKITVDLRKYNNNDLLEDELFQKDIPISLFHPNVLPEINEKALNTKVNDTFDFTIKDTHTHDHDHEHEEGHSHEHTLVFKYQATVKKIEKMIISDLSEEIIKTLSYNRANNIEEFKKLLKETAENQNEKSTTDFFISQLYNRILESNPFTPPPSLVENTYNNLLEDREKNPRTKKTTLTDKDKEALKKQATENVRWYLISDAIIKKENITLTDEVVKELAQINAKKMGISSETLENHYLNNRETRERLRTDAFELFLTKNNVMKTVDQETFNTNMKKESEDAKQ
ncbi:MAG TPA: trigger factor [Ignavibacteriaceae bacterium]|nr:trigger factor [Ignavibacteriaceae bacterium]